MLKRLKKETCLNNELTKHTGTKLDTVAGGGDGCSGCREWSTFFAFYFSPGNLNSLCSCFCNKWLYRAMIIYFNRDQAESERN